MNLRLTETYLLVTQKEYRINDIYLSAFVANYHDIEICLDILANRIWASLQLSKRPEYNLMFKHFNHEKIAQENIDPYELAVVLHEDYDKKISELQVKSIKVLVNFARTNKELMQRLQAMFAKFDALETDRKLFVSLSLEIYLKLYIIQNKDTDVLLAFFGAKEAIEIITQFLITGDKI